MPFTFHLYGFIIGIATIVGLLLAEYRFLDLQIFSEKKRAERFFLAGGDSGLRDGNYRIPGLAHSH